VTTCLGTQVMRKQLHRCRQTGCAAKGHCQYGFPFPAQPAHNTTFDAASQRYSYHRPAQYDANGCLHRNVVPYHPAVLLLWNAHMNIQRITDASWSLYILKYTVRCCCVPYCAFSAPYFAAMPPAPWYIDLSNCNAFFMLQMKTEPTGTISVDTDTLKALGLTADDCSETELKLVAGFMLSRPISTSEAALSLLGIPTIWRSGSVHSVRLQLLLQHPHRPVFAVTYCDCCITDLNANAAGDDSATCTADRAMRWRR
jgi:hypothetical protein